MSGNAKKKSVSASVDTAIENDRTGITAWCVQAMTKIMTRSTKEAASLTGTEAAARY